MNVQRQLLADLFNAAVAAVDSRRTAREALRTYRQDNAVELVALGKAAIGMTRGALDALGGHIRRGLIVTNSGCDHTHDLHDRLECHEAGHPLPNQASLDAGTRLLKFLDEAPREAELLFLLSGGASALVEAPVPGVSLRDLVKLNRWLLGSGLDIRAANTVRKRFSRIKGGGLLARLGNRRATALYISDVAGDRIADIASGPLGPAESRPLPPLPEWAQSLLTAVEPAALPRNDAEIERRIVARLSDAMAGAAAAARERGLEVFVHEERLEGEAAVAGTEIADYLIKGAPSGVHVWGGETIVHLPPNPGRGGRNQSLALSAAIRLAGHDDIALLAAGTDGLDGPGDAAGAIVDGRTVTRGAAAGCDPQEALARADAWTLLDASGGLLRTGPTGTNVADIVTAAKQ